MSLRDEILKAGDSPQKQAVRHLIAMRKLVDNLLEMHGYNPRQLDPKPDPATGCRHPRRIDVTTLGDQMGPRWLCPDCDKEWVDDPGE